MANISQGNATAAQPSPIDHPAEQRVVVVLGMHRSGTSAITRALLDMGVELGTDLMPPMEGNNPTGFWEDMGIFRRSEALLRAVGRSWDSVTLIEPWRWQDPAVAAARADMVQYLRETFGTAPLWGFKDPRTCRLLPFWKQVLSELGATPVYLFILRNPLSVARSLARRDGLPEEHSHLLWLEHSVEAMCDSDGALRLVVDYDRLLEAPSRELERIGQGLGLAPQSQTEASFSAYAREFLRDGLRHTRFDAQDLKGHPAISNLVCRVFEGLRSLALGGVVPDDSPVREVWQAARSELQDFAPFLAHLEAQRKQLEEQARTPDALQAQVSDLNIALEAARRAHSVALAQLVEQNAESAALVAALTASTNETQSRLAESSSLFAEREAQISGLAQTLAERDGQINGLTQTLAERDAQISGLAQTLAERDGQITGLAQTLAERDGEVTGLAQTLAERDAQISGLAQTLAERDGQINGLTQTLAERDAQIASLNENLAEGNKQVAYLSQRVAEQAALVSSTGALLETNRLELDAILKSKSWRFTAPLRAARRRMDRAQLAVRGWSSRLARAAYRAAPLPIGAKLRIKSALFRAFPSVFGHTKAYRDWAASKLNPPCAAAENNPENSLESPPIAEPASGIGLTRVGTETLPNSSGANRASASVLAELFSDDRAAEYQEYRDLPKLHQAVKLIAYYLPQFHPIPENDAWWGKGFTEWTNVTRAKPQFRGHYQPRLPGELGFYDLRLPQVMQRQVELALNYGVGGFCFYFYWFGGKRLLETPLENYLKDKSLRLPFCLCWANENWSRRWDGSENEILIAQQHSPEDDIAFIKQIERFFTDDRYIRVGDRPILLVYRPSLLPDPRATVLRWRQHCESAGLGNPLLVMAQTFGDYDPLQYGCDAAVEFPPHNHWPNEITDKVELLNPDYSGRVLDYGSLVDAARTRPDRPYLTFRTVCPSWDNQPRRSRGANSYVGSTPGKYKEWLTIACTEAAARKVKDERMVFVNAWNEWGEGAYLEPDQRYGYAYLQATADVLRSVWNLASRKRIVVVSHDAHPMGAQYLALHLARSLATHFGFAVDLVLLGDGPMKPKFSEVADVHEVFSATGEDQVLAILKGIRARGASVAILNTTVSGQIAGAMRTAGFFIVSLVHELPGLIRSRGLEKAAQAIASCANRVIFPADCVRRGFAEFGDIPARKVSVRPQGLYARNLHRAQRETIRRAIRDKLGLPVGARIVLGVGHGDYRKGIDLFARVAAEVKDLAKGVQFVWVGYQDRELLMKSGIPLNADGLPQKVLAMPHQEDVGPLFAAADLYLLASREDPFPFVMQHAFDAGIPVLGFEGAGGFSEICDPRMGRLVPYEDTGAMARAVVSILDDRDFLDGCVRMGPALVSERFDFDEYVRDLLRWGRLDAPRVSVVVPNYNYARYIALRLKSIIGQTYRPYEILLLDDCSSDGSDVLAEKLLAECGIPYRIVRNQKNEGVYAQWLRGLQMARGELVWIAEADDYCDDNFLESMIAPFTDSEVVLAYCQSKQIDEDGNLVAESYLQWTQDIDSVKWAAPYCRNGEAEISDSLIVKNTIPNVSAVLLRKCDPSSFAHELVKFRNAGDWFLYSEILRNGKIAFLPETLNHHRRHSQSATRAVATIHLMKEILRVQLSIARQHPIRPETWEMVHRSNQAAYDFLHLSTKDFANYREHPEFAGLLHELRQLEKFGPQSSGTGNALVPAASDQTASSASRYASLR